MPPLAFFALLALAVLWGSAFPVIKLGLEGFSAPHFTLARHLVASLCFVPYLALTGHRLRPRRADVPTFFLLGFAGITVYHLALNYAELRVSAGATSLIIASAPALTALLALFLTDERLPALGWLGSGVAFAGVALIVVGDSADLGINRYAFFALLSALSTALYFVMQKPLFSRYRAVEVVAFATWAGTVPLLLFLPGFVADTADAGAPALAAALYTGVLPSAVAYTLFSLALSLAPVTQVTAFLYSVPVFSLLFSWLMLGEVPTPLTLVGGGVAIGGIALVNWAKQRDPRGVHLRGG